MGEVQFAISKVAETGGSLIGHVAISQVKISDGSDGWFGLGPVSVLPDFQNRGVGSVLIERACEAAKGLGAEGCVVLGDPCFYRRFGFRVNNGLIYPAVPREYFQVLSFTGRFSQGEVSYHEAFTASS